MTGQQCHIMGRGQQQRGMCTNFHSQGKNPLESFRISKAGEKPLTPILLFILFGTCIVPFYIAQTQNVAYYIHIVPYQWMMAQEGDKQGPFAKV